MRNYQQHGDVITWKNDGTDVSAGDAVQVGSVLGVAVTDIAGGATGELAIRGVFELPAEDEISQGQNLKWAAGNLNADAATEGDFAQVAFAWSDSDDDAETVLACLTPDAAHVVPGEE